MGFLGFGKSKPKIEGYIGYYRLTDWWLSAFTQAEREYIEKRFRPMGCSPDSRPLTRGKITFNSQPATEFLNGLATWFRRIEDRNIAERIREKIIELGKTKPSEGPGYYRGRHYTTYVEEVKELKRKGRLQEAEALLLSLIDAVEAESKAKNWGVAPWYYEQLAIIHRQRKDYDAEVQILERFAAQKHAPGATPPILLERLRKARELARKAKSTKEAIRRN